MPIAVKWSKLLDRARASSSPPSTRARWKEFDAGGICQAKGLLCSGGVTYVVKFIGNPDGTRCLATEEMAAGLGQLIGAPIPETAQVLVTEELINLEGLLVSGTRAVAGIHHGSRFEEGCFDSVDPSAYVALPENQDRFAALTVLYTWLQGDNEQWLYKKAAPNVVFSVDHARFLPGGQNWTVATLRGSAGPILNPRLAGLNLHNDRFLRPLQKLRNLQPEDVANVAARIHPSWGLSEEEIAVLAEVLFSRAEQTSDVFKGRGV
jgi:hypothetical protein